MTKIPEQIDIKVHEGCNAACQMCIEEITWKSPNSTNQQFMDSVVRYMQEFYDLGGRKVIITGGRTNTSA